MPSKLPWNGSGKKPSSTSLSADADIQTCRKHIVELQSRIVELEGRLSITNTNEAALEGLSSTDLKKHCLELESANRKLKEKIAQVTAEKEEAVRTMTQKMNLVMDDKDRQLKRHEALGAAAPEDKSKVLSNQNSGKQIRMAISAETAKGIDPKKLPKVPKSKEDRHYIQKALEGNQFFRNLNPEQIGKIIDCMEKKKLKAEVEIIREGTDGTYLYLLEEGTVNVSNSADGHIADLHEGKVFGELAILYNCKRTASVRTKTDCTVYQLDRRYFKTIVQSTGAARDEARLNLLKAVPRMKDLGEGKLKKICDCMEDESFQDGDCIIKQGTAGDLFYIVKEGKVKCTKNQADGSEDTVAELEKGNFFW